MFFFFNDTATTEIYTLSLHDALPILIGTLVLVPVPIEPGNLYSRCHLNQQLFKPSVLFSYITLVTTFCPVIAACDTTYAKIIMNFVETF